ncbi:MAG: hypothetical protein M1129_02570 [Candidatus Thermoplasmatota archaeon]|nr:hypothetical protein [Candidatus Thermoplasmatota archaeon]MCL5954741.1 hypothetical protein [Candidatus Thermoplasmatota archaeon]
MKCSKCDATFNVDVGISSIFKRGNHSAIKTPCPHCGNASFNRILEAKDKNGREYRI